MLFFHDEKDLTDAVLKLIMSERVDGAFKLMIPRLLFSTRNFAISDRIFAPGT